jgi:hypothetical protein
MPHAAAAAAARPDTSTGWDAPFKAELLAVNSTFYFSRKRFGARRRGWIFYNYAYIHILYMYGHAGDGEQEARGVQQCIIIQHILTLASACTCKGTCVTHWGNRPTLLDCWLMVLSRRANHFIYIMLVIKKSKRTPQKKMLPAARCVHCRYTENKFDSSRRGVEMIENPSDTRAHWVGS